MNTSCLLGLLAETSIHPGAGRSTGVVDLPVAREAATDYPVLVGSSLKGALKQWAKTSSLNGASDQLFGAPEGAGDLLIGDARLLLLPVRSLTGAFQWVTCPHLLERCARDRQRAGWTGKAPPSPPAKEGHALAFGSDDLDLFLEEHQFPIDEPPPADWIEFIKPLFPDHVVASRLDAQFAILHDNDFAWFARFGLPVNARNILDEGTKTSKNLWYEETLPPDTLLYAVIGERRMGAIRQLIPAVKRSPYLQAGGNETVGMGWFHVTPLSPPEAAQ